jgi:hypothetical protein
LGIIPKIGRLRAQFFFFYFNPLAIDVKGTSLARFYVRLILLFDLVLS